MERTFASAARSQRETDYVHQSKPKPHFVVIETHKEIHPILDAMNITIDKNAVLEALNKARKRVWGKDREALVVLIGQIATNGKTT